MLMLVTYDVNTQDLAGRRRLRGVARTCLDMGQRVQNPVFECEVNPARWAVLRAALLSQIDLERDSLRFYALGAKGRAKVEHIGAKPQQDLHGAIIF